MSALGLTVVCDKVVSCLLGSATCIYTVIKKGENGDGEDGSEIYGGRERVEIAWPLVCR